VLIGLVNVSLYFRGRFFREQTAAAATEGWGGGP
jgi:hypothetical protein